MDDIETERLILRLVPLEGVAATAAGDRGACRRLIGPYLPEDWFDEAWVSELRLNQWKQDPAYAPWSIRAIALKATGQIVGNMNCHHKPMDFIHEGKVSLAVEIGYTIFPPWRRMGLAHEAIRGFTGWARTRGVKRMILSISPANGPSLALAGKLGAERIGSQIDEIDGPEDIYLVTL